MKTEIYNLIILDESGSMDCVKKQTISGCNETINTIRMAQEKYADTQLHYVSIFAFQSGSVPSRYIIKNEPIDNVGHITDKSYVPMGLTPLYDAVGATLADLKSLTSDKKLAIGNVTIITDGMENASTRYSRQQVAKIIEDLKQKGWSFNFIGANIDVKETAALLNIDNSLEFEQDEQGTQMMFERERRSRMMWMNRADNVMRCYGAAPDASPDDLAEGLREAAADYFADDDDDKNDKK